MNVEQEINDLKIRIKYLNEEILALRRSNIIILFIILLIIISSCSKPTLPVRNTSKFIITDVYFDTINYYQVIDINNKGTRLNRIDGQWFTDTAIYKIGDPVTFKKL